MTRATAHASSDPVTAAARPGGGGDEKQVDRERQEPQWVRGERHRFWGVAGSRGAGVRESRGQRSGPGDP